MDNEFAAHPLRATSSRRRFLQRAGLAGAGAAGLALTASLSALAGDAGANRQPDRPQHSAPQPQQRLHDDVRRLWEDHIAWTRLFIISFAEGLGDIDLVAARLLRNQDEIGDLFRPAFGDAAGDAVAGLLREHILGAATLLAAAKTGTGVAEARDAWYANGDAIARALSDLQPRRWPYDEMAAMMQSHLDHTLDEAVARLEGRFADDIAAWDTIHDQILDMADMLTAGLQNAGHQH